MFAATLTLPIDGVNKVLNRVNQDNFGSSYRFKDAAELITLVVRHSVDTGAVRGSAAQAAGVTKLNRHNVYIERTIFGTPTTNAEFYSATYTLREGEFNDPVKLDKLSVGVLTLMATLDSGLTVGEN